MTKDEATLVMTDVALHRKPHTRSDIKKAKEVLEPHPGPGEVHPKNAANRAIAASAAQVHADAHSAKMASNAETAIAAANNAAELAAAVGSPTPAAEPVLFE